MATILKWDVPTEDFQVIQSIADRVVATGMFGLSRRDRQEIVMDVTAVHRNIFPLRLRALLDADGFNFAHDIGGIRRHLNRQTGELGGCFVPRFAVPVSV